MNKRHSIMLCYPFEEKRLNKWNSVVLVQPKLDGHRCRAVFNWQGGYWQLFSSQANEIFSVPHILDALHERFPEGGPELDGELYNHGMSFEQITSVVKRQEENIHPDYKEIQLHLFDVINEEVQLARTNYLSDLLRTTPPDLKLVPSDTAHDLEGVMRIYDNYLSQNYEGIIVRHITAPYVRKRSTLMMKFKPKKFDLYPIVGWKEEIDKNGQPKGRLGSLECEGDDGTTFSIGTGLTDADRERLWDARERLKGKVCHVAYQHITSGRGVPRFPVFVEIWESKEKKWKE